MTSAPAVRPLLPQHSHMQNFQFAPPNLGLGEQKKNYVFVDEHNRHKRLKVMRACEGCRRRKIKCDAATTNQWPCAACVRLKLSCVPPRVSYDQPQAGNNSSGLERVLVLDDSSGSGEEDYNQQTNMSNSFDIGGPPENAIPRQVSYSDGLNAFQTPPYSDTSSNHNDFPYTTTVNNIPMSTSSASYQSTNSFPIANGHQISTVDNSQVWNQEQYHPMNLSDALGELKIDESGIAPYISQQKKVLAEAPALEEFEVKLPATIRGSGSTVRIPPELMPDQDQAMEYFEIFFREIHPYVPVISKPYFYQQWRTNRGSISPLILEAIFACAGRMSSDPAQGAQWLALASKHEDCFMDVPRLSTIQALLLLLKARESAPKRGYYYRSWMTVKTLVSMAKDLELHEHHNEHLEGNPCGSDSIECLTKTRIWQCIFIAEIMIGGPQGRMDFGVDPETVETNVQRSLPGIEESEYQVSRHFTYLVRCLRNVRILTNVYNKIKKRKDWGTDPRFVQLGPSISRWHDDLPRDLQLQHPSDGSIPWLPSHFIANLHCYFHLSTIFWHRPQLMSSGSYAKDGTWKRHMALSYSSAKSICRLQEAILKNFGLPGMLCMQRGINFHIYAVLTCTMLHLVALTSPDPEFNIDAKDYFTRHMRILENCTLSWPMPDMQAQIDALREAFSADVSKPFELRPSFSHASPASQNSLQPSPPIDASFPYPKSSRQLTHDRTAEFPYHGQPITPPRSADTADFKDKAALSASLSMVPSIPHHGSRLPETALVDEVGEWNPTRIFDQWNTAFGSASSTIGNPNGASNPPPLTSPINYTSASYDKGLDSSVGTSTIDPMTSLHDPMQQQQGYHYSNANMNPTMNNVAPMQPLPQPLSYGNMGPSFVSPRMWRDTVASTFDSGGAKRRWDVRSSFIEDPVETKRAR